MANNINFTIVGKLGMSKETEKLKPYEKRVSAKNWEMITLKINAVYGTNIQFLTVKSGRSLNKDSKIYTFTKNGTDENGNKVKGEPIQVNFDDRNKPEIVERVAEFKKFVVDLEVPNRRYKLKQLLERVEGGEDIGEGELSEVGINFETTNGKLGNAVREALKKSEAKRKEFIHEYDFVEVLHKMVASEAYKDKVFVIKGEIKYSYYNEKFYKELVPTRVYLANNDTEQKAEADYTVYYNKDSLDSGSVDEKGRHYLNAYVFTYDNNSKKNIGIPVQLAIPVNESEGANKKGQGFVKLIKKADESFVEMGFKTELLKGSQRVEITEDMLSEDQLEMLEFGIITMDDIKKEMNGDVYGEKIEETRIVGIMRGYTKGAKETVYTEDDFKIQQVCLDEDEDDLGLDFDEDENLPF